MKVADGNKPINVGDPSFIYKGVYNPIHWIGDKPYRPRVETLVIKDARYVYADLDDDIESYPSDLRYKHYSVPGGSLDADSTKLEQAEAETNEEALVKVSLLYNTGISYYQLYEPGFILKGGDTPLEYYGSISDVFIGVYAGPYDKSLVDPKDLDPKMAEHGKFHDILAIGKYLRKEHIDALLASQFVASDVKASLRLMRKDIVNESTGPIVVPDRYIYHASIYKIDEFKPMALDLGNAMNPPGWSTFCHESYNDALIFGMLRAIQEWAKKLDIPIKPIFNKGHLVFSNEDFDTFLSKRGIKEKFDYFVYTIDSEPLKIELGNDATLREYTFRESGVKPVSVDPIHLSLYDIKESVDIVSDPESEEYCFYKTLLTHEYNEEDTVRSELVGAIARGELKPGDDIVLYMQKNGLDFESDDIPLPEIIFDIDEPVLEGVDTTLYSLMEEKFPIDCYGLPDRKAYPMPDEKHVKSAIRFFNYAKPEEEKELAKKINEKIKEFNMKDINVGDSNRFKKYYKPIIEGFHLKDFTSALESLQRPNPTYGEYEQMKNVIRMMVASLESGTILDPMPEEYVSEIINESYHTLEVINEKQIGLLSSGKEDSRSSSFRKLLEASLNPVLEAGEEDEEDTATDYTAMADDAGAEAGGEGEEEEAATDYTAMADDAGAEEDTPEEDAPAEDTEEEPAEEDAPPEEETGEDVGEDEATDYTAMADDAGGEDTVEDTGEDTETTTDDTTADTTEETDENNNRYDNKELKNYFLLNSFLSMHETVVDVADSVSGMILPTPDANNIMAKVVKNLQTIKSFIEKFIQFQFSDTDYAFNLYYYNILTNALRMNLALLEEAVKIGETKTTKKKQSKEE